MGRSSTDELVDNITSKANYIKELPRRIDSSMTAAVTEWKSLVAKACLPLVLELAPDSSDTTAQLPSSDYMIDLRAGINVLPRRFESQRKPIDAEAKLLQIQHEKKIEQNEIKCYKMNEKGEQFQFKFESSRPSLLFSSRKTSHESSKFIQEFRKFTFPDKVLNNQITIYEPKHSFKYCAYPNCSSTNGIKDNITHLQLCENHEKELKNNLDSQWIPPQALEIYNIIKAQGEKDCEENHHRIYYQLLPQLNKWIEEIDNMIPTDCSGTGSHVSATDAWLVLQLRPIRQLIMLMKSFIFIYRMYLNPHPDVIAALIALFIHVTESCAVRETICQEVTKMIRSFCGIVSSIFNYFGIGILYTLDMIITDDAYLAIILKGLGLTLMVIGWSLISAAFAPIIIVGGSATIAVGGAVAGIAAIGAGLTSVTIGRRMGEERENRSAPDPRLIQVHLNLALARERLWQWIGNE
ncbi:unnamed protein product [Adineta steineri]|uniref:Uncharacterized protein n=1 Tax=Adineta steineri TaxID=433720 RepID=A0A813NWJ3_9BILA|nr:unnamed protein product [Adineta steineri]CAF0972633.1 unnamed protein product [Adineta steineri]